MVEAFRSVLPEMPRMPLSDPDTLLRYLAFSPNIREGGVEFSNYLNLQTFQPFLEELYRTTQEGYVVPQEAREDLLKSAEEYERKGSTPSLIRHFADQKAIVERARVIYYDFDDHSIKGSPIQQGEFDSVRDNIGDILERNTRILLEVHTHPDNSLFSLVDYRRLLVGTNERFIRGAIVVCPDMQILALAMPHTPIFGSNELDDLYMKWNNTFKQRYGKRLERLERRQKLPIKILGRYARKMSGKKTSARKEIDRQMGLNEITVDAANELIQKLHDQYTAEVEKTSSGLIDILGRETRIYKEYLDKSSNDHSLKFARSTNIELYSSTNFRDFNKFSA